jgi:hypothetical protein
MSGEHACESCSVDTAYIRRVHCARCDGLVHKSCRDNERVCHLCRWIEDRRNGVHYEPPRPARPNPKEENN